MGDYRADQGKEGGTMRTLKGLQRLAKAATNECRMQILTYLAEVGPASPVEMSRSPRFNGMSLGAISSHCRRLLDLELIRLESERSVRGATEHVYASRCRPIITVEEWKEMHPILREGFSGHILECFWEDCSRSVNSGLLDVREDRVVCRTPAVVDEEGWQRLVVIGEQALHDSLAAIEEADQRLTADRSAPRFKVSVGQMCFEIPNDTP